VRRVAVIGCGGAGKTVLARRLGEVLALPVVHSDLHRPLWDEHGDQIAGDEWVIDGMRLGMLDERLARADTVVFLDRGPLACYWGILRRRLRYRGGLHADDGVADFVNWEFIRWVWTFRRKHRPRVLELLERHATSTAVVVLRSYAESDAFVERVAATRV
jgi:adenylate kinase family enzyme